MLAVPEKKAPALGAGCTKAFSPDAPLAVDDYGMREIADSLVKDSVGVQPTMGPGLNAYERWGVDAERNGPGEIHDHHPSA